MRMIITSYSRSLVMLVFGANNRHVNGKNAGDRLLDITENSPAQFDSLHDGGIIIIEGWNFDPSRRTDIL